MICSCYNLRTALATSLYGIGDIFKINFKVIYAVLTYA